MFQKANESLLKWLTDCSSLLVETNAFVAAEGHGNLKLSDLNFNFSS